MDADRRGGKKVSVRRGKRRRRTSLLCAVVLGVLALSSCSEDRVEKTEERAARPQAIQRVSVPSTVIPTIGYDADQRILEIEFHNGAVYQYFDVPQYVYDDLKTAEIPGRYFNQHIRKAGYKYRQVEVAGTPTAATGLRNGDEHEQNN
jgi:hypothetical protein